METLYIATEKRDEFELPVIVESNIEVFSKKIGSKVSTVKSCVSRGNKGLGHNSVNGYNVCSVKLD